MRSFTTICVVGGWMVLCSGCGKLEEQTKPTGSIIGKKTQDIGKFDPNAPGQQVSDSQVRVDDPVLGAMQAYGPALEQISKTHIDHALGLFQAEHGRYPKDYDEFMAEIIKKNNIQLPVLPAKAQYKYDETNHKLVIVTQAPAEEKKGE